LSSQALQQGGIGLIMTMLIITIPTIAAALWQGNMGTFMAYSAFGTAASPGPQGQPAGSYMPQQVAVNRESESDRQNVQTTATKVTGAPQVLATPPVGSRGQAGRGGDFTA
ncbi:Type IV secretion system protein virB6, partial [Xanthomonas melonis]|nr:Type IV secretion system protein virB6 [Xanthomonas melonis]